MREVLFDALKARWHELFDQYETVKASLPPAVRWEWTNRPRYDPRPFHFKIHPPRGRVIEPPTQDRQKWYNHAYGFDAQKRVIVSRYYTSAYLWETFYRYDSPKLEVATYTQRADRFLLAELAWYTLDAGRMQYYASLEMRYEYIDASQSFPAPMQTERYTGKGLETITATEAWNQLSQRQYAIKEIFLKYEYDGKQLTRTLGHYHTSLAEPSETIDLFEYGQQGHLQKITWMKGENHRRLLYRRREPGETLATLSERAITKLVAAIPQAVAAAQFTEPIYCLNLYYFRAKQGNYFPPHVHFGLERHRQHKLHSKEGYLPGYIWWYLWSSGEEDDTYIDPLPISDAATLEACERLEIELNMAYRGWYAAKIMRKLARELNKLDWSPYAPVTPDFIVYACDQTEHEEIDASLRYSGATKEQLADWRKRGVL